MTSLEKHALYSILLRLVDEEHILSPMERRDILNQIVHTACGMTVNEILASTENKRKLLIKRGTKAQNDEYIGLPGEITIDTDECNLRVHDGETPGGVALQHYIDNTTLTHDIISNIVPDYARTISDVGNNYTAPCHGIYWFSCQNLNTQLSIYVNGHKFTNVLNSYGARGGYQIMLAQNDSISIASESQLLDYSYFIPLNGCILH